jgi:hypothetical protein
VRLVERRAAGLRIAGPTVATRRVVVVAGAMAADGETTTVVRVIHGRRLGLVSRARGMRAQASGPRRGGRWVERVSLVKNDTPIHTFKISISAHSKPTLVFVAEKQNFPSSVSRGVWCVGRRAGCRRRRGGCCSARR